MEGDIVSSTIVLRKGPILFNLEEKSCWARERGRDVREREKDLKKRREKRNRCLVLVVREMGVLVFKQCAI